MKLQEEFRQFKVVKLSAPPRDELVPRDPAHPLASNIMISRNVSSVLVSIALATAIHLDWHVARPTTHHLSLGLRWHWLLAIPVFGLVAWYVARAWSLAVARASVGIVGFGILLGGVLEPAWEYSFGDATLEWAFGAQRTTILLTFVSMGLVTYVAVLALLRRRPAS